ncbi:MAG: hypothetical protein ACRDRS_01645 [Pseudonocardiaceae bacterium]
MLHVIVPQREGAIGGADLHVLDLAAAQRQAGHYWPLILTPRAPRDYLQRLHEVDLEMLGPGLFRIDSYGDLPRQRGISLIHAHGYEANYLVDGWTLCSPPRTGWRRTVQTSMSWSSAVATRTWSWRYSPSG